MPHGIPRGAMCVQRFDDSLNSAIHTTYRISLRSSSMPEPRDPLLKVLIFVFTEDTATTKGFCWSSWQASPPRKRTVLVNKGCHLARFKAAAVQAFLQAPLMILPQVHLRKPCYDFYFL